MYRDDPLGYIYNILSIQLTDGQRSVVEALVDHRRVLVSSGHSVGKTILAACLVNWFFDTRPVSVCLTTAPTDRQVKDLLWKEVRSLRARARLPDAFPGPKIPRLETDPAHFAHGFTASEATKFQGHHSSGGVFVVFDEAEGVGPDFWTASKTMFDDQSFFLACYNPTTPGSAAHLAEHEADEHGTYARVNLSCLDHPNVEASLSGRPIPIPGAITLSQLETMLVEDSQVLTVEASEPGDIELNGRRYRPGPIAEARCLGRRPMNATTGIWSESLWKQVLATRLDLDPKWPVVIGCDVARYGDDHTIIIVRKGLCLLHVESHVKQNTSFVARRLRELCEHFKDGYNAPKQIPCMIDEGGVGAGVIDQSDGYLFCPVNASSKPRHEARYFNLRAELWFCAREPALSNRLDVSRLPVQYLNRLWQELMCAKYFIRPESAKVQVTPKDEMKALLKRSPDLADAFCLCLYPPGNILK